MGAPVQNEGHVGQGLGVVDGRRPPPEAHLHGIRGADTRHGAPPLDALQEHRLLAKHVPAAPFAYLGAAGEIGAQHSLPQKSPGLGLLQGRLQPLPGQVRQTIDIYENVVGFQRIGSDERSLYYPVRIALQKVPVLEYAGLPFFRVHHQVARSSAGGATALPLQASRKIGPAPPRESGPLHLFDDRLRRHGEGPGKAAVDPSHEGLIHVRGRHTTQVLGQHSPLAG